MALVPLNALMTELKARITELKMQLERSALQMCVPESKYYLL